jgi:hypothetical protein
MILFLLACDAPRLAGHWDGSCTTPASTLAFEMFDLDAGRRGVVDGALGDHDVHPVSLRGTRDGVEVVGGGDAAVCMDPEGCAFHPLDIPEGCAACEEAIPEWLRYDEPDNGLWLDLGWGPDQGLWAWGVLDGDRVDGGCAFEVPANVELSEDDVGTLVLTRR